MMRSRDLLERAAAVADVPDSTLAPADFQARFNEINGQAKEIITSGQNNFWVKMRTQPKCVPFCPHAL